MSSLFLCTINTRWQEHAMCSSNIETDTTFSCAYAPYDHWTWTCLSNLTSTWQHGWIWH